MAVTVPQAVLIEMIVMAIILAGVMERWSVGVDGLDQLQIAEHVSSSYGKLCLIGRNILRSYCILPHFCIW